MPVYDANGNIIHLDLDPTAGNTDGAQGARNENIILYNSGGPLNAAGVPSQQMFDRQRSVQGKASVGAAITTTVAGDTALGCAAGALKTVMPGQAVLLQGTTVEYVYISSSYFPSATATSIPLQAPLVQAGNNSATWDTFAEFGVGRNAMLSTALLPIIIGGVDATANGTYRLCQTATTDALQMQNTLSVAAVGYNGDTTYDRLRSPTIYKAFNAQAVTASTANTPTSIWTPATGKKFRLMGYWFSSTVAAGLIFHDLATVGGTGLMPCPSPLMVAAGSVQCPPIGNGIISAAANNKLWIDATAATTLTGFVWGTEE